MRFFLRFFFKNRGIPDLLHEIKGDGDGPPETVVCLKGIRSHTLLWPKMSFGHKGKIGKHSLGLFV